VTPTFQSWAAANPREWQRLRSYVQQLAANQHPAKPKLATVMGRAMRDMATAALPQSAPPTPPPAPVQAPSPFAGKGLFTGPSPVDALKLQGAVRHVAVQADGRDQVTGDPWVRPEHVARLIEAGFQVHPWEARASEGQNAVTRLGCNGLYIAQAENEQELELAYAAPTVPGKRGLVCAPGALPDREAGWPDGWFPLIETYWQESTNQSPERQNYEAYKRGARGIVLVYGLYPAENPDGTRKLGDTLPLHAYWVAGSTLGLAGGWCFLSETMTAEDVAFMRAATAAKARAEAAPYDALVDDPEQALADAYGEIESLKVFGTQVVRGLSEAEAAEDAWRDEDSRARNTRVYLAMKAALLTNGMETT
jgi:hypothetical protein